MLRRLGVTTLWAILFDLIVLLFAILGGIWIVKQFDYRVPVTVHFRAIKDLSVPAGGTFVYENFFTRNRFCETLVERWFVGSDKVIREIDPLPSAMPTEGLILRQQSTARISVPRGMPPGKSRSCFQSHWQCTLVQRFNPIDGPETCIDFLVEPPTIALNEAGPIRIAFEGEP